MHGSIVRTLLWKEFHRLAGNRGALALVGLLFACALLLVVFDHGGSSLSNGRGLGVFWVDYWDDGPWVEHLRSRVPPGFNGRVRFRGSSDIPTDRHGVLRYGRGEGAVQLRPLPATGSGPRFKAWFWYVGDDPGVLAPFEDWFWRETHRFCRDQAIAALPPEQRTDSGGLAAPVIVGDPARLTQELHRLYRERLIALSPSTVPALVPDLEVERSALKGLEPRLAGATTLVLFALFFTCAMLLPSMTCEERERGTLLAQALSPATATDLLVAKAVAYGGLGLLLAAALACLPYPSVWLQPFFWLTLTTAAAGAFGLGATIASLARTQRAASTGTLCYALAVALVIVISQRIGVPGLSAVLLESHVPPLVLAVFSDTVTLEHWGRLGITALLAGAWVLFGSILFRWRGYV